LRRILDQRDAPAAIDLWREARSCSETVGNDDEEEVGQTADGTAIATTKI